MASPGQPPANKAKLDVESSVQSENPAAPPEKLMPVYEAPKRRSMAELYNPAMITIIASNSEVPDLKETFTMPRRLICELRPCAVQRLRELKRPLCLPYITFTPKPRLT